MSRLLLCCDCSSVRMPLQTEPSIKQNTRTFSTICLFSNCLSVLSHERFMKQKKILLSFYLIIIFSCFSIITSCFCKQRFLCNFLSPNLTTENATKDIIIPKRSVEPSKIEKGDLLISQTEVYQCKHKLSKKIIIQ